jgi:hypothetical protein
MGRNLPAMRGSSESTVPYDRWCCTSLNPMNRHGAKKARLAMERRRIDRDSLPKCSCTRDQYKHQYPCYWWDAGLVDHHGKGVKSLRAYLGSSRVPFDKWVKRASIYLWPLWRQPRKPREGPPEVQETPRQTHARLLRVKPRYHASRCACGVVGDRSGCVEYPWKLWWQHKGAWQHKGERRGT